MKKIKLFSLILTLAGIMTAAEFSSAQEVKGDGNVVKENRSVSSFNKIVMDGTINVILLQGQSESLTIESDKNIIPLVSTEVQDNILHVTVRKGAKIEKTTELNVYVTITSIDKIDINSVGNLKSKEQLKLKDFTIESNSVGNVNLDIDCENLVLNNNSVGNTTLSGKAEKVKINNNGVGNVNTYDLTAQILEIDNNSVGNAKVSAEKEIYISQNGIGNITYKGNAVVKKVNNDGMGKIKKD